MKKNNLFIILCLILVVTMLVASGCSGKPADQQNQPSEPQKVDFPTKTIRLIMPYAAGGGSDILARTLAEHVSKYLPNNQTVVVENKAGGAGVIGTTELIGSKPDGYTIEEAVNGVITFQPHFGNATYTYSDVKPIAGLTSVPNIMVVRADAPWNTIDEWLEYVKANPGKFTYGTVGKGTFAHVAAEGVNKAAGLEMTCVQFDGGAPAITALLGGHVDGAALLATDAKTYVASGDVKVIYTTVETTMYPEAVTPKSKGIDFETVAWTGIFAPKDTPDEIVNIISEAYKKTLEDPEVVKSFETMGYTPNYVDAATYTKIIEDEFKSNGDVLRAIGLIK